MSTDHVEILRVDPKRLAGLFLPFGFITTIAVTSALTWGTQHSCLYNRITEFLAYFAICGFWIIPGSMVLGWLFAQYFNLLVRWRGKGLILATRTPVKNHRGEWKKNAWE